MCHLQKLKQMIKINQYYLIVFQLCVLLSTSFSQEKKTLQDCIDIALEKNFEIRIEKNKALIASHNYSKAYAGMYPSLDFVSQYAGNNSNTKQTYTNGLILKEQGIYNTTSQIGLQASWVVFNGLNAKYRYVQLKELKNLALLNTRISIEQTIVELTSEYYYYVQQYQLFNNLKYAVALSKERVRIEQEHFLLGSGSKIRLLQAEVSLNADSSRLEKQYDVLNNSRIRLAKLMALDDLSQGFIPLDTVIPVNSNLNYVDLYTAMETNNSQIVAALINKNITKQEYYLLRSKILPHLSLNSGYGLTHNSYQTGTLSNHQNIGMHYGLALGINIFDGKNRKREQTNALIVIDNAQLAIENIKQENTAHLLSLFSSYSNNLKLLALETQNLNVARENIEIAFERYRLGVLSGFELREIQKDLLEAEERMLLIQYETKIAETYLLYLSGRIL